jgi:hypothetical protein
VLASITGTDNGLNMSQETRGAVDGLLDVLENAGELQQPRPLQSPLLFGNYNVAYTSSARSSDRGQRESTSCSQPGRCSRQGAAPSQHQRPAPAPPPSHAARRRLPPRVARPPC